MQSGSLIVGSLPQLLWQEVVGLLTADDTALLFLGLPVEEGLVRLSPHRKGKIGSHSWVKWNERCRIMNAGPGPNDVGSCQARSRRAEAEVLRGSGETVHHDKCTQYKEAARPSRIANYALVMRKSGGRFAYIATAHRDTGITLAFSKRPRHP